MNVSGARVAVLGAAATGLSTARVLAERGAEIVVLDRLPPPGNDDPRAGQWNDLAERFAIDLRWTSQDLPAHLDFVVPSPGIRRGAPPIVRALETGVPILSEIEIAGGLSRAPILAVTGTNGKTTTVAWLAHMVALAELPVRACGNLALDSGERVPLIEAAHEAGPETTLVAEVSSFQLEWTRAFAPRGAAWLNLAADHLDAYASMDDYAADKARLFRNQTDDQIAVLNRSDRWVVSGTEGSGRARRCWFDGDSPNFPEPLRDAADQIALPGRHNRSNALAAALLAIDIGVPVEAVAGSLKQFGGVPHRMEVVSRAQGVTWINNSMCTNTAAVAASLSAVPGLVIAIAGGRLKEPDPGPLGDALSRHANRVILLGEAAPLIGGALKAKGYSAFEIADSMSDAVGIAAKWARPGDSVVLAPGCSSFDMYSGFEARGREFRTAVARLEPQ